jgi:phage tail sheath gpL-like
VTTVLSGIGDSPIPRIAREFRFAQGPSTGASNTRPIVISGNKQTTGTETVETLGLPIADLADCRTRFGNRSEITWSYIAATMVDPEATYYGMAVAEGGGATTSSVNFTIATTASAATTVEIHWGGFIYYVNVASGDTAGTQATNIVARINQDPYLPFTAAVNGGVPEQVDVTTVQKGPRSQYVLKALRMIYTQNVSSTVTKSSVSAGTTADSFTNAITALGNAEIYYHAPACTASSSVTTSDGGVGAYVDFIRTQALPINGKNQVVVFGLDCSQSSGASVTGSAAANSVYAVFVRVENNDWPPGMIAAHMAAVKRRMEVIYPAANLRDYTNSDTTPFGILDPYAKGDRPTKAEIAADLNAGVTPIAFYPNGQAYIPRQITGYSWLGSSTTRDYRAREGHIPSVVHFFWEELVRRYSAQKQPNVADDPPNGVRPLKGVDYPATMKGLINQLIDECSGPMINGAPILDPSPDAIRQMKESLVVERKTGGFGINCLVLPVEHNLFDDFMINQGGNPY